MNPRVRKIKPAFWTSGDVAAMSRAARLLFIGLWTFADDHGYLHDSATRLRLALFPGDWDVADEDVAEWLDELVSLGSVERVRAGDGTPLLRVANLQKHQGVKDPRPSRYAVPEGEDGSVAAPQARTARGRARAAGERVPDEFPASWRGALDEIVAILDEIAAAHGRPAVPTYSVARAMLDYPRKDHVRVARDYRAWQLDPTTRKKHKSPALGFRNQLDMADDRPQPRGRRRDPLAEMEA